MTYIKKIILTLFIIGFISPFALVAYFYFSNDYDISKLVNYKPSTTSIIYDRNGDRIANVFYKKNRFYAPFDEIPPHVVEALIAIEDTTFFEHPGINVEAILRAVVKVLKAGKAVQGASTITQQLVKNVLLTREKKLSRKIKEAIYSIKIERYLTKTQILERYLNEIYYGHGYYGIKTAADGYFHKRLEDLTLKETAVLVGLPKAPSTYAPTRNYEISMGRGNRVIERMHVLGWIDEASYTQALEESPTVYNDTLTKNKAPFIVDEVARAMRAKGIKDFRTGGYKVYTTIDLRLQNAGKESLKYAYDLALQRAVKHEEKNQRAIAYAKKIGDTEFQAQDVNMTQLNGALVSLDSATGDILALVGSVDYKKSAFNHATQSKRQPGSAFKPFIYQVALNLGYSGATKLVDIANTYSYDKNGEEKKWQPKNYEKDYKGLIPLREALVHSRNLATINLVNELGLSSLFNELKNFHIKNLPHDLSISLGSMSISPMDLAQYYTAFSNQGMEMKTHLISSIEQGSQTIYEKKLIGYKVSEPTQAFIMATILRDVVQRGTGRRAKVRGMEVAGKTGTTNKNVDAWFAGFSPTIETVVWFGNDNNSPMYHGETGGRVAGPAFSKYFTKVLKLYPQIKTKFDVPEGIVEVKDGKRTEYFSEISKPPRIQADADPEEELLW